MLKRTLNKNLEETFISCGELKSLFNHEHFSDGNDSSTHTVEPLITSLNFTVLRIVASW